MKRSNLNIMILKNSHFNVNIPLSYGENLIQSDLIPGFSKKDFLMFNIHINSNDNFTIRTYSWFPIKIRILSNDDKQILDERVFFKPTIANLKISHLIQIFHLFSKNYFFIENSGQVKFTESIIQSEMINKSIKMESSFSDISLMLDNTEYSNLIKLEEKMDINREIANSSENEKNIEDSIQTLEIKNNLISNENEFNLKVNCNELFDSDFNKSLLVPLTEKERRLDSDYLVNSNLENSDIVISKNANNEFKIYIPTNYIIPRKTIIIHDNDTPLKVNKESQDKSRLLKLKRKNDGENLFNTLKCPICLDPINVPTKVNSCEHEFCKECISQWSEFSNSCPICKKEFIKYVYYEEKNKIEKRVKKKKFKYEDDEEDTWFNNCAESCMVCEKNDNNHLMLVCDKCEYNICHTYCAGLELIPDEEWLCSECIRKNSKEKTVNKNINHKKKISYINTRSRQKYSLRRKKKNF